MFIKVCISGARKSVLHLYRKRPGRLIYRKFSAALIESYTRTSSIGRTSNVGNKPGTDAGLDPEATDTAEGEVKAWRDAGELPYPLTPEPLVTSIEDTLDYPPMGSPGYFQKTVTRKQDESLSTPEEPG